MKVIDFRVRPPYGEFKKAWYFSDDTLSSFRSQTGISSSASALQMDMEALISEMDACNIELGVVGARTCLGLDYEINNTLLDLNKRYPRRFIGAAAIDHHNLQHSIEIIQRYCIEGPCKGIAMEPGFDENPIRFDDPQLYPIFEMCQNENLFISYTTGMGFDRLSRSTPEAVDNIARDFPSLKIIVSHACWPWVTEMAWICLTTENVYMMPDMYIFNHPGSQDYVQCIKNDLINKKCIFGTAYPLTDMQEALRQTLSWDIPQENLENYLYNNAARILGLETA